MKIRNLVLSIAIGMYLGLAGNVFAGPFDEEETVKVEVKIPENTLDLIDRLHKATTVDEYKLNVRFVPKDQRDGLLVDGVRLAKSVDEVIALARDTSGESRRIILREGAKVGKTAQDFIKLADYAYRYGDGMLEFSGVNDEILLTGAEKVTSVTEILTLAKKSKGDTDHEKILLSGAGKARTLSEFLELAFAARFPATLDRILESGAEKLSSIAEIILLSQRATTAKMRDHILLTGATKVKNVSEIIDLAKECSAVSDRLFNQDNHDEIILLGAGRLPSLSSLDCDLLEAASFKRKTMDSLRELASRRKVAG
ncbi:MAG: hypothetical protein HQM10_13250 [Candidatus Riflebacteria bacterium]|nr:hypothetical protein [Candidatus Riflebacteria bacterium]